ncbi:hypothetical protein NCS55_01193400 [Fusarium keratoplasticum]|nr:hypothetical protein NCS55_01193400 [Fusarium keratoplasticum]
MIQPSLEINRALMPNGSCTQNGTWRSRDGTTECLRESVVVGTRPSTLQRVSASFTIFLRVTDFLAAKPTPYGVSNLVGWVRGALGLADDSLDYREPAAFKHV